MNTYTGDVTDIADNIKRLYVEDIEVLQDCPQCGRTIDHSTDYISYGEGELYYYCARDDGGCEHEWDIRVDLSLELTLKVRS